jgi:hypothetical protein
MMSRFFQHVLDPAQGEFAGLRKLLCRLKSCDVATQCAVGSGVYLANTDFIQHFAGIESFRRVPVEEQKQFCSELSDLELQLRSQKVGMALGVGLYRIWLTEVLADRRNVAELLGQELTELSRKGSFA